MNKDMVDNVDHIMTPNPMTLNPDVSVSDALKKMYHAHVRSLPVVDDEGSFVGLFSICRLIEVLLPEAAMAGEGSLMDLSFVHPTMAEIMENLESLGPLPVSEILEKKKRLTVCKSNTSVLEMMLLLHEIHTSLPVVVVEGNSQRLVGIVSYWDVLSKMATRLFPDEIEGTPGRELAPKIGHGPVNTHRV